MKHETQLIPVLIVDDEKKACANLQNILAEYEHSNISVVGIANNTRDAELLIRELKPEAVFLDIDMPKENAFQFLNRIAPFDFEIIFVTAYDEYAIKAFKLNAVDYILKPIDIDEIIATVHKLKEQLVFKKFASQNIPSYVELLDQVQNNVKHTKITLKSLNHMEVVDFNDIIFLEAQGSYCRILFQKDNNTTEIVMSNTLSDYEELMPSNIFCRIHRSYVINCNYVDKIISGEPGYVLLRKEFTLPISRRRFLPLKRFIAEHTKHNE